MAADNPLLAAALASAAALCADIFAINLGIPTASRLVATAEYPIKAWAAVAMGPESIPLSIIAPATVPAAMPDLPRPLPIFVAAGSAGGS